MNFSTSELQELDRIWPLGQQLIVPENGVIFVAGAWKGLYCRYLTERFPTAKIYGFEPQRAACREASNWTAMDKNVSIFPFGIGIEYPFEIMPMGSADTDGCSVLKANRPIIRGLFIESTSIRDWLGVDKINLAVINVEGYECLLLAHWLNNGQVRYYNSLAVQFHPDPSDPNTNLLTEALNIYYGEPKYFDYPTWCYWKK